MDTYHQRPRKRRDAEMMMAAKEIRQGQQQGLLGRRFAFFPMDPLYSEWLPDILPHIPLAVAQSLGWHFYGIQDHSKIEEVEKARVSEVFAPEFEKLFSESLLLRESLNDPRNAGESRAQKMQRSRPFQ